MLFVLLLNLFGVIVEFEVVIYGYVFNYMMICVKDIVVLLDFYMCVFGFMLVYWQEFVDVVFIIYYFVFCVDCVVIFEDDVVCLQWVLCQFGVLEFIYNYGIEQQVDFYYYDGNSELCGFGYLCVIVLDVCVVCVCFEVFGVLFQKCLVDGCMKYIVFIKDFDGYWIEIL